MKFLERFNRGVSRFLYNHPNFGIPRLMLYLIIGNALVYLITMMDRTEMLAWYLCLVPDRLLKGEIWLDNESDLVSDYRTAFDPATMRVLSSDKAAFVSTNTTDPFLGDEPLTHIVNNTCYLDVSGRDVPAELGFTTQDNSKGIRGDADGNGIVNVVDVMHVVGYILNQDLDVFFFNNADTDENLQINVVDAMWIVDYILQKN